MPARQIGRQRLADQQHERVLRLRAQTHLRLQVRARLLDDAFRLTQVEFGAGAVVELQLRDAVRILAPSCSVLRVTASRSSSASTQILVRHRGHQRDLRRLARFRGRQILRERLVLRLARGRRSRFPTTRSDPTPIRVRDRLVEKRQVLGVRCLAWRSTASSVGNRSARVMRYCAARACTIQHRDAQIAVVLQREPTSCCRRASAKKSRQPMSARRRVAVRPLLASRCVGWLA